VDMLIFKAWEMFFSVALFSIQHYFIVKAKCFFHSKRLRKLYRKRLLPFNDQTDDLNNRIQIFWMQQTMLKSALR
jgi:hypothetical protein